MHSRVKNISRFFQYTLYYSRCDKPLTIPQKLNNLFPYSPINTQKKQLQTILEAQKSPKHIRLRIKNALPQKKQSINYFGIFFKKACFGSLFFVRLLFNRIYQKKPVKPPRSNPSSQRSASPNPQVHHRNREHP